MVELSNVSQEIYQALLIYRPAIWEHDFQKFQVCLDTLEDAIREKYVPNRWQKDLKDILVDGPEPGFLILNTLDNFLCPEKGMINEEANQKAEEYIKSIRRLELGMEIAKRKGDDAVKEFNKEFKRQMDANMFGRTEPAGLSTEERYLRFPKCTPWRLLLRLEHNIKDPYYKKRYSDDKGESYPVSELLIPNSIAPEYWIDVCERLKRFAAMKDKG